MRRKQYGNFEVPSGVARMVNAICADYYRRDREIRDGNIKEGVARRYVEFNVAIDNALCDIEEGIRFEILRDISENRGYLKSSVQSIISKNGYYNRRRKLVRDVALALDLI